MSHPRRRARDTGADAAGAEPVGRRSETRWRSGGRRRDAARSADEARRRRLTVRHDGRRRLGSRPSQTRIRRSAAPQRAAHADRQGLPAPRYVADLPRRFGLGGVLRERAGGYHRLPHRPPLARDDAPVLHEPVARDRRIHRDGLGRLGEGRPRSLDEAQSDDARDRRKRSRETYVSAAAWPVCVIHVSYSCA